LEPSQDLVGWKGLTERDFQDLPLAHVAQRQRRYQRHTGPRTEPFGERQGKAGTAHGKLQGGLQIEMGEEPGSFPFAEDDV
jgi:hypothetical protein